MWTFSIVSASAIQFVSLHFLFDSVTVQTGHSGKRQVSVMPFYCKSNAIFVQNWKHGVKRLDALNLRFFILQIRISMIKTIENFLFHKKILFFLKINWVTYNFARLALINTAFGGPLFQPYALPQWIIFSPHANSSGSHFKGARQALKTKQDKNNPRHPMFITSTTSTLTFFASQITVERTAKI